MAWKSRKALIIGGVFLLGLIAGEERVFSLHLIFSHAFFRWEATFQKQSP